jgi:hypothetical protein
MPHVNVQAGGFETAIRAEVEGTPMRAGREQLHVEDRIAVGFHVEHLDVHVGKGHNRSLGRLQVPDAS